MSGHRKKITSVSFHPTRDVLFTSSADKTARVWFKEGDKYSPAFTYSEHQGDVNALTVHPSGDYVITASADRTWAFWDVTTGSMRVRVPTDQAAGYTAASFHPDGLILGTGSADSQVLIWDMKSQSNVAKFEGHRGEISSLAFSENGYYLATSADTAVKLWDLRKLVNFKSLAFDNPVSTVSFDYSGQYLAVGGADLRYVYYILATGIVFIVVGNASVLYFVMRFVFLYVLCEYLKGVLYLSIYLLNLRM